MKVWSSLNELFNQFWNYCFVFVSFDRSSSLLLLLLLPLLSFVTHKRCFFNCFLHSYNKFDISIRFSISRSLDAHRYCPGAHIQFKTKERIFAKLIFKPFFLRNFADFFQQPVKNSEKKINFYSNNCEIVRFFIEHSSPAFHCVAMKSEFINLFRRNFVRACVIFLSPSKPVALLNNPLYNCILAFLSDNTPQPLVHLICQLISLCENRLQVIGFQ